ncbi:peptidoglycan-recognition protein SC2-like [Prorops nasuta]|uniref:peptidoglycan-recognition protein SC2-like n=1 Tax=Prorops nasuta TaxID=863751 RepID=UPI0034CEE43D
MNGRRDAGFLLGLQVVILFGHRTVNSVEPPNIISRSEWGARNATGPIKNLSVGPTPYVLIHHSDTGGCITQALCQAKIRLIQNYHINVRHWGDIGYNFLVGEDGNVYEGRGWDKHGAHSKFYNSKSIGICIVGNYTRREPNVAAVRATKQLIAYGASIDKISATYTLLGHKQTAPTLCPGDKLYELIKSWPHWSPTT